MSYKALLLLSLVACRGPAGEQGPQGVAGISEEMQTALNEILPYQSSAVLIQCYNDSTLLNSGSGIKISGNQVLTAAHLVTDEGANDANNCALFTGSSTSSVATTTSWTLSTQGRDLAVINISSTFDNWTTIPSAPVLNDQTFEIGQTLLLWSHPLGWYDPELTIGNVTNIESAVDVSQLTPSGENWSGAVDTTLVATNGSSGGAVFNATGSLVALMVGAVLTTSSVAPLTITTILPLESADNL